MRDGQQDRAGWQGRERRWAALTLLLCGSLGSSSCLFQKKPPRAFAPPPIAAKIPPDSRPIVLPDPPETPGEVEAGQDISVTASLPPLPAPPKPAPVKPRSPEAPAAPSVVVVEPPAPGPPKPVQIYTAEEQRALARELEDSLNRVRQAVATAESRSLSVEQRDIVNRIKTFQIQAEQERTRDLMSAVSLARRADLLARDLLSRLP